VALSLGSLPVGVTHRLVTVEPGLSSTLLRGPRPPDRLVRDGVWRRTGRRSTFDLGCGVGVQAFGAANW